MKKHKESHEGKNASSPDMMKQTREVCLTLSNQYCHVVMKKNQGKILGDVLSPAAPTLSSSLLCSTIVLYDKCALGMVLLMLLQPMHQELWLIRNSGMRKLILPLHDICSALGNDLIKCLPAVHALTGCDTTSKIATKSAALNAVQKPGSSSLVLDFNSPQLTESSILMAETSWSNVSNQQQTWRHLMTYVSLHSIAMPSSWTL